MNNSCLSVFRIAFESREQYRVINPENQVFPAALAGRVRHQGLWPAVGDWVEGHLQPSGWVQITAVLERTSLLVRKDPDRGTPQVLAANVDTLLIVTSANQDLNLNRLDRYVALASSGNIRAVILVNKIELATDPQALLDQVAHRFPRLDVLGVSAHEGWNLNELENYAHSGQTVALVGSSGVGKSSLTNFLLGEDRAHVQEIREQDGRGRHTTTTRELHIAPTGAIVIDTPGIRQVGLTDDSDLAGVFSDIETLASQCRFTDCRHNTEPGCGILKALAEGQLEKSRWQNYLKLEKELAFERRKTSKALQSQENKRWIQIHKQQRARLKAQKK